MRARGREWHGLQHALGGLEILPIESPALRGRHVIRMCTEKHFSGHVWPPAVRLGIGDVLLMLGNAFLGC